MMSNNNIAMKNHPIVEPKIQLLKYIWGFASDDL